MKEIYIIRHGETEWARAGKHTGLTDVPLTEKGEIQAASLGRRIEKIKFSHVFTSPLKRAKETCDICGFDGVVDRDLVEWDYGAYEGMTSEEIQKTVPEWNIFTHGAPAGESIATLTKRVERLIKKLEGLDGKTALFTSGHLSRALTMLWLEIPLEKGSRFPLNTASLSILGYEKNQRALKLWNDVSHLKH
ncbi:MAG: histidine phosphatase family protein [Chlamydiales bacterium]|nr:histidine phosphatase family protein [Chlamydiales bacterium]